MIFWCLSERGTGQTQVVDQPKLCDRGGVRFAHPSPTGQGGVFPHPTLYLLHLRYNVIEIKIGQSAGNQEFFKKMNKNDFKMKGLVGTSETTRENIIIPKLSIHRPDHKYPDANQIGYYLAGLIDGDG